MESGPRTVVHGSREALRKGYSPAVRPFELGSIAVYVAVMAGLAVRLLPHVGRTPWTFGLALLLGFVAADFVSGFVHWAADTWGAPEWPIIGQALIRPFREHHLDEKEITRHDFVETNGNNCFISFPAALAVAFLPQGPGLELNLFVAAFTGSLVLWVLFTNQFHKWSHLDRPPRAVAFLQKLHLILPPEHHAVHHRAPYAKYYCITTGWLNEPLYRLGFFQGLERAITALTGQLPREDDLGKSAALALVNLTQAPGEGSRPREVSIAISPEP